MQPATEPGWPVSVCSSKECGAAIIWARAKSGSRTLVDAAPTDGGRWRLVAVEGREDPVAEYVAPADRAQYAGRLYTSHWATCPRANDHRRPK